MTCRPYGPPGHEDLGEHVVEVVARVRRDLDAAGEHGHLHRRREVGRAEDDRLQPGRGGADRLDVDQAEGGLDLRLDPDVADRQPGRLLDLGQQEVHGHHLRGALDLGQHDLVQPGTGAADDGHDVVGGPLGRPVVDPDAEDLLAPVLVPDGGDDLVPRALLLLGRDRVLQVEEDHVGRDARALAQHLLGRSGDGQAGPAREVTGASRHGPAGYAVALAEPKWRPSARAARRVIVEPRVRRRGCEGAPGARRR